MLIITKKIIHTKLIEQLMMLVHYLLSKLQMLVQTKTAVCLERELST